MAGELEGKVALVTGASSGIGRAVALAYARAGAKVIVSARREAESLELVREIESAGGVAKYIQADMANRGDIKRMVDGAVEAFGRLDVACNNAGIEGSLRVPTAEYTEENWDNVIAINLTGVWLSMKHEIPHMLATGGGAIVNISSVSGLVGTRVGIAYSASKWGVVGMTKSTALEYATQGIRVNAVCPAVIVTPMGERLIEKNRETNPDALATMKASHPIGRLGTVDEVADAVLYLSSARSSFVTGHALALDGGYTAT